MRSNRIRFWIPTARIRRREMELVPARRLSSIAFGRHIQEYFQGLPVPIPMRLVIGAVHSADDSAVYPGVEALNNQDLTF